MWACGVLHAWGGVMTWCLVVQENKVIPEEKKKGSKADSTAALPADDHD